MLTELAAGGTSASIIRHLLADICKSVIISSSEGLLAGNLLVIWTCITFEKLIEGCGRYSDGCEDEDKEVRRLHDEGVDLGRCWRRDDGYLGLSRMKAGQNWRMEVHPEI